MGDDDIDGQPDQLGSKLGGAVASPHGVAELKSDILAFRIAKGGQTSSEGIGERKRGRCAYQHTDAGQLCESLRERSTWRPEQNCGR